MSLSGTCTGIGQYYSDSKCSADDCAGAADFFLKRYDTNPPFRVSISDCDGALDLSDPNLMVEVNMWAKATLKKTITAEETVIRFAGNTGFDQIMVGDVLRFQNVRTPELVVISAIDENSKEITVIRGATPGTWKKGTTILIYRIVNAKGYIETVLGDIIDETGSVQRDQLIDTNLIYEWDRNDTILPGCYYFEFKLFKLNVPENKIFSGFEILNQYQIGAQPKLISPEIVLTSNYDYAWSSFALNPLQSEEYDYFTILGNDQIEVQTAEDGTGVITVTSQFINNGISVIPMFDEGDTLSTISITNNEGGQVQSIQPGMVLPTQGEILFDNLVVANFTTGNQTPLIVLFNSRGTKEIVERVLRSIVFVNLSSEPELSTRSFTYQMIDSDNHGSDLLTMYLGIDSLPPVEDLEGIEWVRRFPCHEGFIIKITPTAL